MKNYVYDGEMLTWTNGGSAVSSGDPVVVGGKMYIAAGNIAGSAEGELAAEGVFTLTKATPLAISQGDKLFYDAVAGKITKTATGNTPAGVCWKAAGSADTTVDVKLGDMGDVGIASVVAELGTTDTLTALVPTAATISGSNVTVSTPPVKSEIDTGIDALKDKVVTALAAKADNAGVETLRGEIEARLDDVEGKCDAILTALKASGQMASA